MNLLEIRTLFVQLSGRRDLVKRDDGSDYADNGANALINAGQALLDSLIPTHVRPRGHRGGRLPDHNLTDTERSEIQDITTVRGLRSEVEELETQWNVGEAAVGFSPTNRYPKTARSSNPNAPTTRGSNRLVNDTDESWWSVQHEMTLVHAAQYEELVSRGRADGAAEMLDAIQLDIEGIKADLVDHEVAQGRGYMRTSQDARR